MRIHISSTVRYIEFSLFIIQNSFVFFFIAHKSLLEFTQSLCSHVKQGTLMRLIINNRRYSIVVLTGSNASTTEYLIDLQNPYHVRQTGATSEAQR